MYLYVFFLEEETTLKSCEELAKRDYNRKRIIYVSSVCLADLCYGNYYTCSLPYILALFQSLFRYHRRFGYLLVLDRIASFFYVGNTCHWP